MADVIVEGRCVLRESDRVWNVPDAKKEAGTRLARLVEYLHQRYLLSRCASATQVEPLDEKWGMPSSFT